MKKSLSGIHLPEDSIPFKAKIDHTANTTFHCSAPDKLCYTYLDKNIRLTRLMKKNKSKGDHEQ